MLQPLDKRIQDSKQYSAKYQANLSTARSYSHLLSGELIASAEDARRILRIAKSKGIAYNESWGHYLAGSSCFRAQNLNAAASHFGAASDHQYIMHARTAIDALAGLALAYQASGRRTEAEDIANDLLAFARELNDLDALSLAQSAQARLALAVNGHRNW